MLKLHWPRPGLQGVFSGALYWASGRPEKAGIGHNRLPNLPTTCYTEETPPLVHITRYRCSGPSLYGSGSLNREPAISTLWNQFTGAGCPRESFLRCSSLRITPYSGCDINSSLFSLGHSRDRATYYLLQSHKCREQPL